MSGELRAKAVGGVKWGVLTSYSGAALSAASSLALGWLLSPEDWGPVGAAMVVISLVRSCGNFGVNYALVHWRGDIVRATSTGLTLLLGISGASFLVVAALTPVAGCYFRDPAVPLLTLVLATVLLIRVPSIVAEGTLRKEFLLGRIFAIEFVSHLIGSAAAIAVAIVLPRPLRFWALVVGGLTWEGVKAVLSCWLTNVPLRFGYDREAARGLFHYGKFFAASSVLMVLYLNADRLALGRMFARAGLGLYAYASAWTEQLGQVPATIFGGVMLPLYAKLQDDPAKLRWSFCRTTAFVSLVAAGLLGGLALVAPEAVRLVLPERWAPVVLPIQILALYQIVRAVDSSAGALLAAIGRTDLDMRLNAVNLVGVGVLVVLLTYLYGPAGAALALFLARVARMAVAARYCARVLQCPVGRLVAAVMPAAQATLAMVAAVWGVKALAGHVPALGGWLGLAAMVAAGAGAFIGFLAIFHRELSRGILSLVRDAIVPSPRRQVEHGEASGPCASVPQHPTPNTQDPSPTCPLCGGTTARRLAMRRGWGVVRCTNRACGLVFAWPQPTAAERAALYCGGEYHAEVDESERRRAAARRLRQVEQATSRGLATSGRFCATRRILDVGCSRGYFLEAAARSGWEAVGVELNPHAVEDARAKGLDVREGELSAQAFEPESFDAVTLFDVLEHVPDPLGLLRACHRLLRPGGVLVVATPDAGGLVPRLTWQLFGRTLGAWGHPTPPGHLVEFSRRTLRQALAAAGFEAIRLRSEHIPFAYSVGKQENAIMDVLAGRESRAARREGEVPCRVPRPACQEGIGKRRGWRGLPRLCVRAACWLVVGGGGLVARALAWGDSSLATVRRPVG